MIQLESVRDANVEPNHPHVDVEWPDDYDGAYMPWEIAYISAFAEAELGAGDYDEEFTEAVKETVEQMKEAAKRVRNHEEGLDD